MLDIFFNRDEKDEDGFGDSTLARLAEGEALSSETSLFVDTLGFGGLDPSVILRALTLAFQ